MFKELLFKLGSDPHKSWATFQKGLIIFAFGAMLIFAGNAWWMWLQIPAVIMLIVGLLIAAKGYLGIFANRFSHTLNQLGQSASTDKQNNRLK